MGHRDGQDVRRVAMLLNATVYRSGEFELAFLSREKDQGPVIVDVPTLPSLPEANAFDVRWIFTGAGCRGAGSVSAVIRDGKVMVRGRHTVGAGNRMTLTAERRLSGDSGSGTDD